MVQAGDAVLAPGDGIAVAGATNPDGDSNIRQLARNLYNDHVLAFELTSVLLIVAVAGTVLLTRKWPKDAYDAEEAKDVEANA